MTAGEGAMFQTHHLPEAVTQVKKEAIKSFSHSKRVGGYLLGRTLGVGSFAKVKEGLHLTTGQKVAVKVIDKKRAKTDNYVRKNLRREGKLLQLVRHPNVVALFEVMETDNSYYLVTELCTGGDLMEYISAKKRLPESEVSKYIRQIVSAVDYLHRLGIIHRDLKIENLLLDGNKNIKLIDFGLSNFIKVANSPEGTKAQEFCVTQCGSPAYAAPELLNHEKYGLAVDLWSIGVNMYAMLTGGLPFTVDPFNIKALYAKMRDRQMNPVPDDLSRECKDLLRKFLNPDPARRVTIVEALNHPWLMQSNKPILRHPCPNKMKTSDLDADILSHMSENLGFRMGEVIKFVTCNTPSSACATYHLYLERLVKHKAETKSTGQTTAMSKAKNDGGRITLHLQDMRTKDAHKQNSVSEETSPTPRLQSRGMTSVATEDTDTTITTNNSKKDSGIGTERSTMISGDDSDRKENRNPLAKFESITIHNPDMMCESPPSPDTSRPSSKAKAPSAFTVRHVTQRPSKEPLSKGNTALGVSTIPRPGEYHTDVGRSLLEKLTHNARINVEKNDITLSRDFKFNFAHLPSNNNRSLPSPPLLTPHTSRQTKTEVTSVVSEQNGSKASVDVSMDARYKFHKVATSGPLYPENIIKDSNNNNESPHPSRPRRYIQNNKLLSRRGVGKSIDASTAQNPSDKAYTHIMNSNNKNNTHNAKAATHPSPTVSKITPKQYVPFRSAQDRPRLSENQSPLYVKQPQKAKTSDSMTLHGKNVLNTAFLENSGVPSKRPVSPPPKPVIVRRRLAKRHRLGELTPPGSHVIQDIDQTDTTDLLISDILDTKPPTARSMVQQTSPLPSISPLHSTR